MVFEVFKLRFRSDPCFSVNFFYYLKLFTSDTQAMHKICIPWETETSWYCSSRDLWTKLISSEGTSSGHCYFYAQCDTILYICLDGPLVGIREENQPPGNTSSLITCICVKNLIKPETYEWILVGYWFMNTPWETEESWYCWGRDLWTKSISLESTLSRHLRTIRYNLVYLFGSSSGRDSWRKSTTRAHISADNMHLRQLDQTWTICMDIGQVRVCEENLSFSMHPGSFWKLWI